MKRSGIIVVIAVLFAVMTVSVANANILVNGGFEDVDGENGQLGGTWPDGWTGWGWSGWHHTDEGRKQDTMGIKMWWDDIWQWQDFAATAGTEYTASIDVMNSTLETTGWDGIVKLEWFDGDMNKLYEGEVARFDAQADEVDVWVTITGSDIAPEGAVTGRYTICLSDWYDGIGGALNFDNAVLVPEPATLGLLGLGGLLLRRRKK